jgi:hypothetical protein
LFLPTYRIADQRFSLTRYLNLNRRHDGLEPF